MKKLLLFLLLIPTLVFAQTSSVGVKVQDLTRDSSPSRTDLAYSMEGSGSVYAPRKVYWGDIVDLTGWTITGTTITTNKDVTTTGTVTAAHFSGDGTGLTGTGAVPAGSGSELQYRGSATALGALSGSSVSGSDVVLGGTLKLGTKDVCLSDGTNCPAAAGNGMTDDGTIVHLTTNSDNLGVGTTTAPSKLTVAGTVAATAFTGDGSALTGIGSGAGGWTDDGTNVRLTGSTDNVGIGSTVAPTKLYVVGGVTSTTGFIGPLTGAVTGNVTGNASTATALSVNPNNCTTTGQFPTGVDASGVAEGCTTLVRQIDIDTSAEVASIVTDETGTGSLVFSSNPRFTGNMGIGSTAPGVALDVQGTIRALGFSGAAGGWTNATAGKIVPSNVTDNVGVGTTLPEGILDVGTGHHFLVDSSGNPKIDGGATPSLSTFGQLSSDNNAWATGRGALLFNDGTAGTFLVGTLSADTPTDGQVPKWNTGGTITWENDNNSGSGSSITIGDTRVPYANGPDNLAGDAGLTYAKTPQILTAAGGFQSNTVAKPSLALPAASNDSDWIIGVNGNGATDDDALNVGVGTTVPDMLVKLTVARSGNVGIGSSAPNNNLDVNGTAQAVNFKMTQSPIRGASLISNDAVGLGTWMANVINVRSYGATGDGSTDDTSAIQAAMTAAAGNGVLYFPKPATYYKITSTLRIVSNQTIRGDNSKIHMAPAANEAAITAIFDTNNSVTTSNVDISGLYVESANSVTGTGNNSSGNYDGATTSFIMGFNIHNTSDIRIHDCTMDALVYGLKIDTTANTHLFFNNLKIINTGTPVYGSNITDAYFNNMYLDSTSYTATNGHLHSFYFETTVDGVYFNGVSMNNTAGACIQLYQSGGTGAKNITGKNITCSTAADFMIIWSGAKDVKIDGFRVKSTTKLLNFDDAHNVQLSHGYVDLKTLLMETQGGTASDHVTLDHIQVDASTKTSDSDLFILDQGAYITLSDLDVYGITANDRLVYNNAAALTNFQLKDSEFYFAATPADNAITIRHVSSTGKISGNKFINQAAATTNAVFYNPGTAQAITVTDNVTSGFPKIAAGSDVATNDFGNTVNGFFVTNGNMANNVGIGTWRPSTFLEIGTKMMNVTSGGSVGIGSINPGTLLDVQGTIRGTALNVGIGTTVAQQLCRKSNGTIGYFNGVWNSTCN